jgi:hypothetical protein
MSGWRACYLSHPTTCVSTHGLLQICTELLPTLPTSISGPIAFRLAICAVAIWCMGGLRWEHALKLIMPTLLAISPPIITRQLRGRSPKPSNVPRVACRSRHPISSTMGTPDDWTRRIANAAQRECATLSWEDGRVLNPVEVARRLDPLRTYFTGYPYTRWSYRPAMGARGFPDGDATISVSSWKPLLVPIQTRSF